MYLSAVGCKRFPPSFQACDGRWRGGGGRQARRSYDSKVTHISCHVSQLLLFTFSLLISFSYPSISLLLPFPIFLLLFSSLSQPLSARHHVERGTPEAILDHVVKVHSANSDNGTICTSLVSRGLRTRLDMYMTHVCTQGNVHNKKDTSECKTAWLLNQDT